MKCEQIHDGHEKEKPKLGGATAQIYKDQLYIFGGTDDRNFKRNELWSFDLSNYLIGKVHLINYIIETRTWKLCETTGEGPAGRYMPNSSVIGDNLFIYGGDGYETEKDNTKDIFVLDFSKKSPKEISV